MTEKIVKVYEENNSVYGSPKAWAELRRQGGRGPPRPLVDNTDYALDAVRNRLGCAGSDRTTRLTGTGSGAGSCVANCPSIDGVVPAAGW